MEQEVLVVGANGRIGRASVQAFLDAGWKVRAFVLARCRYEYLEAVPVELNGHASAYSYLHI
ncbi:MAG: hypothetical protein E4H00_07880 [Myxococcales bacterium]|nr:MAG: hypothetical protein E4H00_07880 [Myxococcales bacterium]